jgi:plastocyanin
MSSVKNLAGRATGAFAIILVAVALVAAACGGSTGGGSSSGGSSGGGSSSGSGSSSSSSGSNSITEKEFSITPATITAKAGDTLTVQNTGTVGHNLVIADSTGKVVAQTTLIQAGQSAQLALPSTITAGSYTASCSVPGHKAQGMTATLTVS